MGLGLYISRQIIELHGGSISAEFPDDGGTCIAFTLPH
jgi:signal transduction histidine kinase